PQTWWLAVSVGGVAGFLLLANLVILIQPASRPEVPPSGPVSFAEPLVETRLYGIWKGDNSAGPYTAEFLRDGRLLVTPANAARPQEGKFEFLDARAIRVRTEDNPWERVRVRFTTSDEVVLSREDPSNEFKDALAGRLRRAKQ